MRKEIRSDEALLRAVAARTMDYDYSVWYWGDAVAMDGLWVAGQALDETGYTAFVIERMQAWARRPWRGEAEHMAPGLAGVAVVAQTGDERVKAKLWQLAEWHASTPRSAEGVPIHRPDLPDRRTFAWVDSLYHGPAFLVEFGRAYREARYVDLGVADALGHARVLQESETGLFHHGYDVAERRTNAARWGRGQGWALLGLVDTLEALPDDHPARAEIRDRLVNVLRTMQAYQDYSGHWHTLIDDRNSYLETSVAAFVCAGVGRLRRTGLLTDEWQPLRDSSWAAVRERVDERGNVVGVSYDTHLKFDAPEHYRNRPLGHNPWGQGAFLRAAAEPLRR